MIVGIVCDESILQANFVKIFEFRIKISSSSLARFTFFFFQVFNMYTFYYLAITYRRIKVQKTNHHGPCKSLS